ncbi:hypothetical protein DFH08DRAFT_836210 [Mycena albidolilacea]|uniref:Uncharacterized protein n=1 Tax=Mycena albidolilacea TaxID=1033008 RepID=A0AAD7AT18_9AGAR|nr:hypothetical protein DFH08DRAFT_836210 [Mycena albidolilacea]
MEAAVVICFWLLQLPMCAIRRRELRDPGSKPHISIIDSWKLKADAWLATELTFFRPMGGGVGVQADSPHRSRRQHPRLPVNDFFDYLPNWCHGGGEFRKQIRVNLWSIEAVAGEMKRLAEEKDTQEGENALIEKSVDRSIALLRNLLPKNMAEFDNIPHGDAMDTISAFAAIFCWWPKWITGTDPGSGRASNADKVVGGEGIGG